MKAIDQCCHGDCNQGREGCPLYIDADPSNARYITAYIVASVVACCIVYAIGLMQTMDEYDAQTAAHQVMACSDFPKECRDFEKQHRLSAARRSAP